MSSLSLSLSLSRFPYIYIHTHLHLCVILLRLLFMIMFIRVFMSTNMSICMALRVWVPLLLRGRPLCEASSCRPQLQWLSDKAYVTIPRNTRLLSGMLVHCVFFLGSCFIPMKPKQKYSLSGDIQQPSLEQNLRKRPFETNLGRSPFQLASM